MSWALHSAKIMGYWHVGGLLGKGKKEKKRKENERESSKKGLSSTRGPSLERKEGLFVC